MLLAQQIGKVCFIFFISMSLFIVSFHGFMVHLMVAQIEIVTQSLFSIHN